MNDSPSVWIFYTVAASAPGLSNKASSQTRCLDARFTAQSGGIPGRKPCSGKNKKRAGCGYAPCPFLRKLLAQTQLSDQGTITVDVLLLQIGQQIAAAADHLEQAAAAVVVMLVALQMLGQVVDARGEQRNLDLRRTGVALNALSQSDDGLLFDSRFLAHNRYLFQVIFADGAVRGNCRSEAYAPYRATVADNSIAQPRRNYKSRVRYFANYFTV